MTCSFWALRSVWGWYAERILN